MAPLLHQRQHTLSTQTQYKDGMRMVRGVGYMQELPMENGNGRASPANDLCSTTETRGDGDVVGAGYRWDRLGIA